MVRCCLLRAHGLTYPLWWGLTLIRKTWLTSRDLEVINGFACRKHRLCCSLTHAMPTEELGDFPSPEPLANGETPHLPHFHIFPIPSACRLPAHVDLPGLHVFVCVR